MRANPYAYSKSIPERTGELPWCYEARVWTYSLIYALVMTVGITVPFRWRRPRKGRVGDGVDVWTRCILVILLG